MVSEEIKKLHQKSLDGNYITLGEFIRFEDRIKEQVKKEILGKINYLRKNFKNNDKLIKFFEDNKGNEIVEALFDFGEEVGVYREDKKAKEILDKVERKFKIPLSDFDKNWEHEHYIIRKKDIEKLKQEVNPKKSKISGKSNKGE